MALKRYSPEQRRRNQLSIVLGCAALIGILALSGTMQGWSGWALVGVIIMVLVLASPVWWLFASRSAGPLPMDRKYAISEAESFEQARRDLGKR